MRWAKLAAAMALASAIPAQAGLYGDELSKCLVRSATDADRAQLMQWMMAAYAASDAAREIVTLDRAQHDRFNRVGAALFNRLILEDCRSESVAAIKYEGASAVEASFETLGKIAGRGLMTDPKVAAEMERFGTLFDQAKFAELGREAGIPQPKPTMPPPK